MRDDLLGQVVGGFVEHAHEALDLFHHAPPFGQQAGDELRALPQALLERLEIAGQEDALEVVGRLAAQSSSFARSPFAARYSEKLRAPLSSL